MTTENRKYAEHSTSVKTEEKLCANFINCKNRTGYAVWYIAGAHYCDDCGRKTSHVFDSYVLSKKEVGKTVNGYPVFKVRRCKE